MHFLEFSRRSDLWEFFCYGPRAWAHEYMAIGFFKLTCIARRYVLKELDVCDFDKTWSACQQDDGSCCDKLFDGHVFL